MTTAEKTNQGPSLEAIAKKVTDHSMATYPLRPERAALRCALGDAAHFCDEIAKVIRHENRGRSGHVSKTGQEKALVAERCANAIWAMRDLIIFSGSTISALPDRSEPTQSQEAR